MQSPPPYNAPRGRGTNTGLIIALVVGGLALCCILSTGLLVGGGLMAFNKSKPMISCLLAFEDLGKAIRAYADAHDGKLPKAATWQTDVLPYYRTQASKHKPEETNMFAVMPADGVWGCETPNVKTGIVFNVALSGKKLADIKDPDTTILLFEAPTASMNANGPYKARPPKSGPAFIMGQPRPWIELTVSGHSNMNGGRDNTLQFESDKNGQIHVKSGD